MVDNSILDIQFLGINKYLSLGSNPESESVDDISWFNTYMKPFGIECHCIVPDIYSSKGLQVRNQKRIIFQKHNNFSWIKDPYEIHILYGNKPFGVWRHSIFYYYEEDVQEMLAVKSGYPAHYRKVFLNRVREYVKDPKFNGKYAIAGIFPVANNYHWSIGYKERWVSPDNLSLQKWDIHWKQPFLKLPLQSPHISINRYIGQMTWNDPYTPKYEIQFDQDVIAWYVAWNNRDFELYYYPDQYAQY